MPPALTMNPVMQKSKKIVFDDNGEALECSIDKITDTINTEDDADDVDAYFNKREKMKQKRKQQKDVTDEIQQKWFEVFPQIVFNNDDDVLEMKEKEQMELYNLCKSSYDAEKSAFNKRNPSDARWLQTALHKGTAKDRANAGALLVTSNPLGNLESLSTLIGYTKLSNKASTDVIGVLTDLWQEILLPPQRKLIAINMRGTDWKMLRNDPKISKEKQKRIYAYWYFENELKDCYFEFLKNLQQALQNGQESHKNSAIVAATKLLSYAPEKEQMLLTMLVNKLGDPLPKVASKALHHLTDVAHCHPNMCMVIVAETEKLLFRNNISDRAQHFALCYLASIATAGTTQVCTKLVNICFALFKVLVQKGAINNRTMQAILRCLQKAIAEAQNSNSNFEILNKDMQDTVYRLVHLADIRIAVQTLGLLLQLITVKTEKSDRFYNALYKKMLDMELTNIGTKTAAQLLHIIHRAIHMDSNVPRAKAFIKRLLQLALYMPSNMAAGCLIVIYKLMRNRRELTNMVTEQLIKKDETHVEENVSPSEDAIVEKKEFQLESKPSEFECNERKPTNKYDAYHRVPSFAGAEFAATNELLLLNEHVHPTVKLFAQNLLNHKRITYYGDPLRDFGLPYFLERFAFKNPKKLDQEKPSESVISHKHYMPKGSRGQSVKSLTKENCTEDEMYIFNYLEQKRQNAAMPKAKKSNKTKTKEEDENENENEGLKPDDVDDDEFDDYLDGFFGKKTKAAADDEEINFLKELEGGFSDESKTKKNKRKQKKKDDEDDDVDDIDADWGEEDDDIVDDNGDDEEFINFSKADSNDEISDEEEGSVDFNDENENDSDGGSISLDEIQGSDNDDEDISEPNSGSEHEDDEDESESGITSKGKKKKKTRKNKTTLDAKSFEKKIKSNSDMSSLFAAADEFAELLEEAAKVRGQGTSSAVFNKDKSSAKQMKWEEKRRSNSKIYTSERKRKFGAGEHTSKGKKFSKKPKP